MSKYRVSIVVEASSIQEAVGKFIYDSYAEPVLGISDIEAEEWDL